LVQLRIVLDFDCGVGGTPERNLSAVKHCPGYSLQATGNDCLKWYDPTMVVHLVEIVAAIACGLWKFYKKLNRILRRIVVTAQRTSSLALKMSDIVISQIRNHCSCADPTRIRISGN
jgi:hypothetical protein